MYENEGLQFQVDVMIDGQSCCRIYQYGIPGAIASTDGHDTEEEAIEAAETLILENRATNEE